ncbi:MAG: HAD family hydrolase [Termitinemataceae bacterium]|nr:MAG: HAD family hydrolase [Termitinemataceae bacterium]
MSSMKFDAVAFDLDGTLYPDWRFYIKIVPSAIKNFRLMFAFRNARNYLRKTGETGGGFYDMQAALCAKVIGSNNIETRIKIISNIYDTWQKKYKNLKLYPFVPETLKLFRQRGLKLGLLTDFQLKNRLDDLRLSNLFDVELCSEDIGALKPHKKPFQQLSQDLETDPQRILYVGNNLNYDIFGAKNAGFGAAALLSRNPFAKKEKHRFADFVFNDYRQLQRFVLE